MNRRRFLAVLAGVLALADPGLAGSIPAPGVPGVGAAILADGEIAATTGEGVLAAGGTDAVTGGTLFQACSLSKPAAALGVLRLAEQGRVDLDRDINEQLRSWRLPRGRGVTPRLLLCHAAGVSQPGFAGYGPGVHPPSLPGILDATPPANHPPIRVFQPPAASWAYSGGGYCLLQLLVEESTGMAFAHAMEELVFAPLGMRGLYSLAPDALRAWGHDGQRRPYPGGGNVYPELAAAGMWCAPADLARLGLALLRGLRGEAGPVSPGVARWMATPATPRSPRGPLASSARGPARNPPSSIWAATWDSGRSFSCFPHARPESWS